MPFVLVEEGGALVMVPGTRANLDVAIDADRNIAALQTRGARMAEAYTGFFVRPFA